MICQKCEGKRVYFGFGGMKHICTNCKGTGTLKKAINEDIKIDKRSKQYRDEKKGE